MKIGVLVFLLIYWTSYILLLSPIFDGNPFATTTTYGGINVTGSVNSSGFNPSDEIENDFFSLTIGAFTSMIRFFGFALFGILYGITVPTAFQFVLSTWQVVISIITIAFIVSIFWEG